MLTAEGVYLAYRARAKSGNWVKWAQDNQRQAEMLNRAMIAAEELDG